ncbi:protein TMED8 [Festucalex cinctus]
MERLEDASELQSRLSSLSISSFPGLTSKHCDSDPTDRLPNTDLSTNLIQSTKQAIMNASEQRKEANDDAPAEHALGDQGETNSAGSPPLSAEIKAETPPPKPPSTWTSAALKELKAKLRTEKDSVATVYRGDIMTVHVPTVPEGKRVCWEFATDGYDIGFGIFFDWTPVTSRDITVHISESSDEDEDEELEGQVTNGDVEKGSKAQSNSNLVEIIPVYRQDSHLSVCGGSHDFPGEGTYLFKFDNSYSIWRNKTLYYRVYYSA